MKTVTPHHVVLCQNEFYNWNEIRLKPEVMEQIIQSDASLHATLKGWYDEGECGLDTQDRDILFDAVAKFFTGSRWPMYGDGKEASEQFQANLASAIAERESTLQVDKTPM